jgi:CRP-like cAMP-binding protein
MGCTSSSVSESKLTFLKGTPFFLHLSEPELREFSKIFGYRRVPVNNEIFHEGDLADKWYIIGMGSVDITVEDPNAGKKFLCNKQAGDFFGEAAILSEEKKNRNATATAAGDDCELLELTKEQLERFLNKRDQLRERIFHIIGRRMENYLGEIPFLANMTFRERQLLGSMLHYVPLKQGNILFSEGSIGRNLYLVYQGTVNAVSMKEGQEVVLNTIKEGQFFGEIGLMIDMPRTATIVAVDDSLLLELRKEDFQNFLQLAPSCEQNFKAIMKKRIAEHFRKYNVPFFSAIPEDKYQLLAQLCTVDTFEPGTVIFAEGDVGNTFYIIAHGDVEVSINKPDKGRMKLNTMGPGKYFGEIALVRDTLRTATITTVSRCVILSITKENFEKFFEEVPEAVADFQVKLARYDAELKHFIHHPLGLEYFTKHLQQEVALENLNFWKDIQKYKTLPEDQKKDEAEHIISEYLLQAKSPQGINVKGNLLDNCITRLRGGDYSAETFQDCVNEALKSMERESFKRFKESNLFQQFLEQADTYSVDNRQQRRKTMTNVSPQAQSKRNSGKVPLASPRASNALNTAVSEFKGDGSGQPDDEEDKSMQAEYEEQPAAEAKVDAQ